MMMKTWFSMRMRSSVGGPHEEGGRHISGAERIVAKNEVEQIAKEMIQRAFNHSRGKPDFISLKMEEVKETSIQRISPLQIQAIDNGSPQQTKDILIKHLSFLSLSEDLICSLHDWVTADESTRGAIIVDINNGKRIDQTGNRGVRVTHFDWEMDWLEKWSEDHPNYSNNRRLEAIALASKVASAGTICEICCSDDPEYTTGYITYNDTYFQIPHMKKKNIPRGGRIFLVDPSVMNMDEYIHYLEKTPVLIGGER